MNLDIKFTQEELKQAKRTFGITSGIVAFSYLTGIPFEKAISLFPEFSKTNIVTPGSMLQQLTSNNMNVILCEDTLWPSFGLVRIQWGGEWTYMEESVKDSRKHVYWLIARSKDDNVEVLDLYGFFDKEWMLLDDWSNLLPDLLSRVEPQANGNWFITHTYDIKTR